MSVQILSITFRNTRLLCKNVTDTACSRNFNLLTKPSRQIKELTATCEESWKPKYLNNILLIRLKKTSASFNNDDTDFDPTLDKDSKIMKINVQSTRLDLVLKGVLSTARNKIEKAFYESKIRLNGKKVLKKSLQVNEGDEIDVIKSVSPKNPDHLIVSRVEIMKMSPSEESIAVTARRFKTLLIENYEDPYKGSSNDG